MLLVFHFFLGAQLAACDELALPARAGRRSAPPERDAAYEEVSRHFSETEIVELSYCIAAIRACKVLNIPLRNQIPEQAAPGL